LFVDREDGRPRQTLVNDKNTQGNIPDGSSNLFTSVFVKIWQLIQEMNARYVNKAFREEPNKIP
jgi:hypothetical protein